MIFVILHKIYIFSVTSKLQNMETRYVIPLEDNRGHQSRLSEHFGRSQYYAIVSHVNSTGTLSIKIEQAPTAAHGGACGAADIVRRFGSDSIVVRGIGMRAVQLLRSLEIIVYKTESETLDQVMKDIQEKKLSPIIEGEACSGGMRRSRSRCARDE